MACSNLTVEGRNKDVRRGGILKMTSSMEIVTLQIGIAWLNKETLSLDFSRSFFRNFCNGLNNSHPRC